MISLDEGLFLRNPTDFMTLQSHFGWHAVNIVEDGFFFFAYVIEQSIAVRILVIIAVNVRVAR